MGGINIYFSDHFFFNRPLNIRVPRHSRTFFTISKASCALCCRFFCFPFMFIIPVLMFLGYGRPVHFRRRQELPTMLGLWESLRTMRLVPPRLLRTLWSGWLQGGWRAPSPTTCLGDARGGSPGNSILFVFHSFNIFSLFRRTPFACGARRHHVPKRPRPLQLWRTSSSPGSLAS